MNVNDVPKKKGGKRPGSGRKAGSHNKITLDLKNKALEYSEEALSVFVELMRSETVSADVRLRAASCLLDRSHGKPTLHIQGEVGIAKINIELLNARYEKNMEKTMEYARIAHERRALIDSGKVH
jgi:hypothetical protein